jgi:rubrerythrin
MKTSNPVDVMRMALEREKTAKEPSIREMFLYLVQEEEKHVKLLQDEIDREVNQEM